MNLVVEKYSDMIYKLAFSRTQNKADAENITQEVFLKYLKENKEFKSEEHRKAWLLRVTINTGKSYVTTVGTDIVQILTRQVLLLKMWMKKVMCFMLWQNCRKNTERLCICFTMNSYRLKA